MTVGSVIPSSIVVAGPVSGGTDCRRCYCRRRSVAASAAGRCSSTDST